MKKVIVLLVALILIASTTFAETISDVDIMIYGHNLYSGLTGATELSGEPKITKSSNEMTGYYFNINGVDVGFIVKDEKVKSCFCRCKEDGIGEFLSQSASILYNICGSETISYWYPNLLDQFLTARAGQESEENPFIQDICMFKIGKENGVYTFIASIVY